MSVVSGALAMSASDFARRSVAVVSVLLVGANLQVKLASNVHLVPDGLMWSIWPELVLLPLWLPAIGRYRLTRTLMAVASVAVASGAALAYVARADHLVSAHQGISAALLVVTAFGAIGVLLWACGELRMETVAMLFGIGLTAAQLTERAAWVANPWKYGFALPVAIIGLGWAGRVGSRLAGILVLTAVGLVSVFSDYRSFAGFCVITIMVLAWQVASRSTQVRVNKAAPLLMLAAIGGGAYFILSNLLVGGYLGSGLQERSVAQVEASGSLLVGGRPEWVATVRLMTERPQGYGFGVLPNAVDIAQGDAGLQSVNIDPAYGYELYMFGGGFRLHSIIADLWAEAGWAGLLLAAVIFLIVVRRLSVALAERTATPLLVFTAVIAIWGLAFSPIFTNLKDITLAAFVALSAQSLTTASEPTTLHRRSYTRRQPTPRTSTRHPYPGA